MTSMLAAVVLLVLGASQVRADAIEGPPACPPGARGQSSHAGQWCVPWSCATDAECEGGSCRPWRVCTRASMVPPGGRGPIDRPPATRRELVVGTCDIARACTGTEEPPPNVVGTFEPGAPSCVEATFCVPQALPPLPPRGGTGAGPTSSPPASSGAAPSDTESPGTAAPTSSASCACASAGRGSAGTAAIALAAIALGLFTSRRR